MRFERIGNRGLLVSFDDPYYTNMYIVISENHIFILDTFLGSAPMDKVKEYLNQEGYTNRSIIIFNSHADYDHYWGNGSFESSMIIGHRRCRDRIIKESSQALIDYSAHKRGVVVVRAPNFTFTDRVFFPQDNIEFFYSPGHTLDSASCYDAEDGVLFAGDNIESPIPYLNHVNFDQYIETLNNYLEFDWKVIIAGHDPILKSSDLINQNLRYLSSFKSWEFDLESMKQAELHRHVEHNLVTLKDELMLSEHSENFQKHLDAVSQI